MKIKQTVLSVTGRYWELDLPSKRIVCYRCHGEGKHVNPSIDGHGLTFEDFAEDQDFAESYFSGRYDVVCEECRGNRVIDVIDEEALHPRMLQRLYRYENELARDRSEYLAELRMGA